MIIPDINLLVYAYNADAPHHKKAKAWWEALLSDQKPVGLPWAVSCGFIRIMTDSRILLHPLDAGKALHHVQSWLDRTGVEPVTPGTDHIKHLRRLFDQSGVAARLTTDVHIAAIALELNAEIHSNDRDFGRFPALRWRNPLED